MRLTSLGPVHSNLAVSPSTCFISRYLHYIIRRARTRYTPIAIECVLVNIIDAATGLILRNKGLTILGFIRDLVVITRP